MHTVKITHGEVFTGKQAFHLLTSKNGLVAAKLAKIRKAIAEEAKASAEGFDAIAKTHATKDDKGELVFLKSVPPAPEVKEGEKAPEPKEPEQQFYGMSGTKAYEMTDEAKKLFEDETTKYLEGETEVEVPQLSEADMQWLICAGQNGQELPIPGLIGDVLQRFAPAL